MQNVVFYVGKYKLNRNNNKKIIYVKMNYQNSCSFLEKREISREG